MNTLPYPTLLDSNYTLAGNEKAFREMPNIVQMFQGRDVPITLVERHDPLSTCKGQLDDIFDHLVNERKEYDSYHIFGEMLNQFIQGFPELNDAWAKLSADQKWIFVEGIHYGIEPPVRESAGYKQV